MIKFVTLLWWTEPNFSEGIFDYKMSDTHIISREQNYAIFYGNYCKSR